MNAKPVTGWLRTLLIASSLSGLRASAQLTHYSTLASWEAALPSATFTSLNFQGLPTGGLPERIVDGVDFRYDPPGSGALFALVPDFYYPGEPAELSAEQTDSGFSVGMSVTFNQPVFAISMDVEAFLGSDFTFTINGSTYTQAIPAKGTLSFVGLVSDSSFTSFTVSSPYEFGMNFADLNYATAVPEPSAAWLLGLGIFAIRAFRPPRI